MMFPLRALVICYIIAVHADGDESKKKTSVKNITNNDGDESKNEASVKNITNIDNSKLPKIHIVVRTYRKAEVVQDDAQQQDVEFGDSSSDLPIDITDREEMINERAREHDSSLSVNVDRAKFNEPENSKSNDKAAINEASLLTQSFARISNMATLAWDYVTHTEKQTQPPTARDDLSGSEDFKEVPESPETDLVDDEKGANDVYFEEDNLQSTEEVSHVFLEENSIDQHDHTFLNHTKRLDKDNNGTINDDGIKLDSPVHKIKPTSERNITNGMVENSQLKPWPFSHPRKNSDNSKVQKGSNNQIHYSGKNISSAYSQLENIVNGTHKHRQDDSNETLRVETNEENTPLQADQPSYLWSSIFERSDTTGDHTAKHPDTGPEDTEMDDDTGSASPVYGYDGDVLDIDRSPTNARHSYRPGLRYNSQRAVAEADLNTSSISRLIDHYDRCDTCMVNVQTTSERCHFYTDQADEFDKLAKYYTDVLRYGCSSPDAQRRCCHGQLPITQTTLHEINKLVRSISNVLWTQCQKCPVDCSWSEWQPWNHCPLTCDRSSTRNRTRTQIAQRYGGQFCPGDNVNYDTCNYERGTWLSWSSWSSCSSTCGGTKHRTRTCSQPTTYSCFVPCDDSRESSHIEVEKCGNTTGCCEQGTWLSWSAWSACSSTCGGSRHRTRKCTQPTTYSCFVPCDESLHSNFEVEQCGSLDGCCYARQWSQWGAWTDCDTGEARSRTQCQRRWRSCEADPDYIDQPMCPQPCPGPESGVKECCILASWGEWSGWRDCIGVSSVVDLETGKQCGNGCRNRTRKCNPGTCPNGTCYGDHIERMVCSLAPCCVSPIWSQWCPWSECSVTIGKGIRRRTRVCQTDPDKWRSPTCQAGGCYGQPDTSEVIDCKMEDCAPSFWDSWGQWSDCDFNRANPRRTQTRRCIKDPDCPDLECSGEREREEPCPCPQPSWGSWGHWSECDFNRLNPSRTKTRHCIKNSDPACWHLECRGERVLEEPCVCTQPSWDNWGQWSDCDFRQPNPRRTQTRRCNKSWFLACQHLDCAGESERHERCVCEPPYWESWSQWGACDQSSNPSVRQRNRLCRQANNPQYCPQENCVGDSVERERCCEPPYWESWSQWGACDQSSKPSVRQRHRLCRQGNNPQYCPQENCVGDSVERERCCEPPYWESWSQWGACDQSSNPSVRQRNRLCRQANNPQYCPQENCVGDSVERERCCERPYWESWSQWGACDQSSNPPVRQRHRLCRQPNNPQYCPQETCFGDTVERERCCGRQTRPPWGEWSQCDVRSNPPVRTRVRQCSRPDPGCPDDTCIGGDRETIECTPPCDPGFWSSWGPWSGCDCMVTKTKSRRRSKNSQIAGRPLCPPSSEPQRIPCDRECPDCQDTCTGRKDGEYPSCRRGCRHFVTCCEGVPLLNECNGLQQYDSICRKCTRIPSQTCPDGQYDIYINTPTIPQKRPEEC